jgi:tetratricopeptide (TPR) repeat protein
MVSVSHAIARRDEGEIAGLRTALEQAPDLLVHECARYSAVVGHNVEESHRIASILTASTRVPEVRAIGHVLIALSQITRGCIRASKPEFLAAESFARALGGAYRALAAVLPFVQTPRGELEKIRRELSAWKADKEPERGNYMSFIVHTQVYPQLRLYLLGILNVRLGKLSAALDNAAKLEKLSGPAEAIRLGFDLALSICAHVACAEGHPREALGFLEKTIMQPPYERVQMQSPFFSENAERYLRARLLEDAGRLDEALHWYETMCENGLHEFVYLAPTHFRRGVIHQRLGQRDEAATNFAKVTQLWANADAALRPLVTQAARFC